MAIICKFFNRFRKPLVYVDEASCGVVRGWVKLGASKYRPMVEIFVDEQCIGRAVACQFRQDLLDAEIGDGCYGFHIVPRVSRLSAVAIAATIKIDGAHRQQIELTPFVDPVFESFAKVIEDRVDAIMAISRERWERELKFRLQDINKA